MSTAHKYGADLTRKQFVLLCIALCTGTLIEWFDFTIYSQLSNVITEEFFPKSSPALQQISYWAVFALGFVARPLGSLVFGHIGDSSGRRTTLLLSILFVSVPTILIGCLPTYHQIGIAAPILMAILRFVQGLAVGGEFGSAIVYLFETAPAHRKGTIASLGQMAIAPGIGMGLISCIVVMYACTPAQLALWGWRIPFLLTAVFAPVALLLRMHMPEPKEFLVSKQEMVLQRVASKAASRAAASFNKQYSRRNSGVTSPVLSRIQSRQLSRRLQTLTEVVVLPTAEQCEGAAQGDEVPANDIESLRPIGAQEGFSRLGSVNKARQSHSITHMVAPGPYIQAAEVKLHVPKCSQLDVHDAGHKTGQVPSLPDKDVQRDSVVQREGLGAVLSKTLSHRAPSQPEPELDQAVLACEEDYAAEVQQLSAVVKHHMPLLQLARLHWREVVLQFLLEANYGATFYTFFSWVPTYLRQTHNTAPVNTLWPILIGMVLFPTVVILTGRYISDSHIPNLWSFLAVTVVIAGVSIPLLLFLHAGAAVAQWLLLPLMLGLCGVCGGLMTGIGPQIYPAAVRTSGYNLGHNLAMTVFGGFTPIAISALSVNLLHPPALSAGVVIVVTAGVAALAAWPLVKIAPQINARAPVGSKI